MPISKTVRDVTNEFGWESYVRKNDQGTFDFGVVCMDNGRFRIGDIYAFNHWLYQQIEKNNLDLACVARTNEYVKTLLWFDCDYMKDGTTYTDVLESIKKVVTAKYGNPTNENNKYIVLKNSSFNKYHFYVTKLFLSRQERKQIWFAVNVDLKGKAIIDVNATDLRFEGFNKYDATTREFIPNTNYRIIFPKDVDFKQFYDKVNLLQTTKKSGWSSLKKIKLTINKSLTSQQNVNSNGNSRRNSYHSSSQLSVSNSNNNSVVTLPSDSDDTDQQPQSHYTEESEFEALGIDEKVDRWHERFVKVKTNHLFASIQTKQDVVESLAKCVDEALQYKIHNIQYIPGKGKEDLTIFNCVQQELCPFTQNHNHFIYLLWNHHQEKLTLHCYDANCKDQQREINLDYDWVFPNNMEIDEEDDEKYVILNANGIQIVEENDEKDDEKDASSEGSVANGSGREMSLEQYQCSSATIREIREKFPWFVHILRDYPIDAIKKYSGKNGATIFQCGKSLQARRCPFLDDHVHRKSNYYLVYKPKDGILEQKCHSPKCENKSRLLWRRTAPQDLPQPNDSDLARYFKELYDDFIYSNTDPLYVGFYFKTPEFWIADEENRYLQKRIQLEFAETIDDLYKSARNEYEEERLLEIIDTARKAAQDILKFDFKSKHLINSLKTWLWKGKIEWNASPLRVVFPNGVLNLETFEFGNSAPEEYINNNLMMGVEYEPRDEAFIQKEIHQGIFLKTHPDAEIRRSFLQFSSLAFEGRNFKRFAVNHGPRGNNAKTKTCGFIIYTFGSYGHFGSNDILLKGKKDRASIANLHKKRVIAFEEPDDAKPLDASQIKAIVGVDSINARMLYSTHDQIALHHISYVNLNSLPGLDADEAFIKRLIYYPWNSMFTSDADLVNRAKHIYLAVEKYGDRSWWKIAGCQLVHYLLDHYRQFISQGRVLFIPEKIKKATTEFCHANDAFMCWFNANYELLDFNEQENAKQFVTVKELLDNFNAYSEKDKVFPQKRAITSAFFAKQLRQKDILANRWRPKITNWRISYEERRKNKNVVNIHIGQYAGAGLIYCKQKETPEYSIWNYDNDPDSVNNNTSPTYNALMDILSNAENTNNITNDQIKNLDTFFQRIKRKRREFANENDDSSKSPATKKSRRSCRNKRCRQSSKN